MKEPVIDAVDNLHGQALAGSSRAHLEAGLYEDVLAVVDVVRVFASDLNAYSINGCVVARVDLEVATQVDVLIAKPKASAVALIRELHANLIARYVAQRNHVVRKTVIRGAG